jgi:hypothetical protein
MKMRLLGVSLIAIVAVSGLAGCSTQARAERKGKDAGDQICGAKNADNANEAQRHLRKADDSLDDLARFTGTDIRQDLRDLDRNLSQLARGRGTSQDINAIITNIEDARATARGNTVAAYDGLLEALNDCN